jgi:uncharacterized protein YpmS
MTANSKIKINLDSLKSRREWKRHKVKDGHNLFRILPPFGESSNGYPYRKWQIIWGLVDPESGRARPFASSLTTEKRCPVVELVADLKKRADNMKALLQASGSDEDTIKARLEGLNKLISDLTPKTVYVYNAADKSGDVGLLELKSTAHKKMKTEMNQYIQDYNQDPTSLNSADDDSGVWFDVTRQGLGRDTEYDVTKCQTKVKNGNSISFVDDRSPLPDSVVENYDNLAYDLSSVYQVKSYDELSEVLNYNLPNIIDAIPDADLSVEPSLTNPTPVSKLATTQTTARTTTPVANKTVTKSTNRVTTRLDDEDDQDTEGGSVLAGTTARTVARTSNSQPNKVVGKSGNTQVQVDDDFMAEADAILNG